MSADPTPPTLDTRGALRWAASTVAILGFFFLAYQKTMTGSECAAAVMGVIAANLYPKGPPPPPALPA